MGEVVKLEVEDGLATLRIGRAHGNAINPQMVEELIAACGEAQADPATRGVLFASSGKLFSPGLDLQELVELDRAELGGFVERFGVCLRTLYTFPKPLVAAIHGHAVAGGCVLALTADWRLLREGALIGLNEVRVGVPFPFGVAMILRESVPIAHLEEVALFARNYEGQAAVDVGLAHELYGGEEFERHCRERLAELADKDARAFALTKRYLRSITAKRLERDRDFVGDFLDCWFSSSTQQKIRAVLAELRARSR